MIVAGRDQSHMSGTVSASTESCISAVSLLLQASAFCIHASQLYLEWLHGCLSKTDSSIRFSLLQVST